jgi:hypothetical protein
MMCSVRFIDLAIPAPSRTLVHPRYRSLHLQQCLSSLCPFHLASYRRRGIATESSRGGLLIRGDGVHGVAYRIGNWSEFGGVRTCWVVCTVVELLGAGWMIR